VPECAQPTLLRAIGRWSLAALMVNCIIGSGIFGLPSVIFGLVGNASPLAWLFAALASGLVMACFAEVSSRFEQTGGVYLYTRTAFGRTTGITVAWLGFVTRLAAMAASANLFVIYLAGFWPAAVSPIPRTAILTLLLGFLTAVNCRGVRSGTTLSNLFTAAKLITLGAFIAVGLAFLALKHHPLVIALHAGKPSNWFHAVLLLMFAYGGYETAVMPGGEAKNPRRDFPFALFTGLAVCTVVYTLTQWVVISVLPQASATERPMAAAAQLMLGTWGAGIVSVGVLVSCYGYLSANILGFPRMLFALAENRDLPSAIGKVHPKFRTPYVAIIILAGCSWIFSLVGSFQWNLTISAITRLIYYGAVCVALPVLRHKPNAPPAAFRLPWGNLIAALAAGTSLLLFRKPDRPSEWVLSILAILVLTNSVWAARRLRAVD
jgi:APA family basic amino acid/polyamine antiporter